MSIRKGRLTSQGLLATPVNFPIATIHAFAGTSAPEGWAMCDGSEVSKTQYAALYAVIGDIYGTPVDSNNFVLPDLRGEFLRGLDNMGTARGARGVDSGRALGSAQNDTTRRPRGTAFGTNNPGNHSHEVFPKLAGSSAASGSFIQGAANNATYGSSTTGQGGSHTHSITTGGDVETRPRNCAINYIIKL